MEDCKRYLLTIYSIKGLRIRKAIIWRDGLSDEKGRKKIAIDD